MYNFLLIVAKRKAPNVVQRRLVMLKTINALFLMNKQVIVVTVFHIKNFVKKV